MILYGITWFFLLLEHMSTFWFYTSMHLFSLYVAFPLHIFVVWALDVCHASTLEVSHTGTLSMLSDHCWCRWASFVAATPWSLISGIMGFLVMQSSCTLWPSIPYFLRGWMLSGIMSDTSCVAITLGTLPLRNPLFTVRPYCWFLGSLSNVVAGFHLLDLMGCLWGHTTIPMCT